MKEENANYKIVLKKGDLNPLTRFYSVYKKLETGALYTWILLEVIHEDDGLEAAEAIIQMDKATVETKPEIRYYE